MTGSSTQSLERALSILFAFSHRKLLLSIEEIAQITGIPKSSCYRLIKPLIKQNLIQLDPEAKAYRLGFGLLKLHSMILDSLDISRIAMPFLEELARYRARPCSWCAAIWRWGSA